MVHSFQKGPVTVAAPGKDDHVRGFPEAKAEALAPPASPTRDGKGKAPLREVVEALVAPAELAGAPERAEPGLTDASRYASGLVELRGAAARAIC